MRNEPQHCVIKLKEYNGEAVGFYFIQEFRYLLFTWTRNVIGTSAFLPCLSRKEVTINFFSFGDTICFEHIRVPGKYIRP